MIGSRSLVALFWILSATAALGNGDIDSKVVREENANGAHRSLRLSIGGDFFGLFAKKTCRKVSEGVFETVSTPRLRAFFGSLFGASQSITEVDGACDSQCADLCPTSCFGSSKADGSKCTCEAFKCSGNAACSSSDKCECKLGFNGNGVTCCDSTLGLTASGSVCVAGSQPTGPMAPSAPSPTVPTAGPPVPLAPVPTVPVTVPTVGPPVPTAPRPPSSGRDIIRPRLLDFVALSPLQVDVSSGTGKMEFQVTAQDDQSGLLAIYVYADTAYRDVLYNKTFDTPVFGKVVHRFSMPFSKFVQPGGAFLTVGLEDFVGNGLTVDSEQLAEKGFPHDIEIVNIKTETAPPELLELKSLTPLAVNVSLLNSSSYSDIVVQATVQDDFSGFKEIDVRWRSSIGIGLSASFSLEYDDRYYYDRAEFPLAGQPLLVNLTVTVGSFNTRGVYALESITLEDFADQSIVYNATTLVTNMMPLNITIFK